MTIKRSTRLKINKANLSKINDLDRLFNDYKEDLQFYLQKLYNKQLALATNLSSKQLPINKLAHSQWRQIIYKQASQMYRSQLQLTKQRVKVLYKKIFKKAKYKNKYKYFTNKYFKQLNINYQKRMNKICLKNLTITIDNRLLNSVLTQNTNTFNQFIGIKLPYFHPNKKLALQINIPLTYNKHYRKFNTYNRKNSIRLLKQSGYYFIQFIFEKHIQKKPMDKLIGVDVGFKKILVSSQNVYCGKHFFERFNDKIKNKKRNSKSFKNSVLHKNNELRHQINCFLKNFNGDTIVLQDLNKVKTNKKTKYNGLTNWNYRLILDKLQRDCQLSGYNVVKVSPHYTSQQCSNCLTIDKSNRSGQTYICSKCGLQIDADYNASINILQRGVSLLYSNKDNPSYKENLK